MDKKKIREVVKYVNFYRDWDHVSDIINFLEDLDPAWELDVEDTYMEVIKWREETDEELQKRIHAQENYKSTRIKQLQAELEMLQSTK